MAHLIINPLVLTEHDLSGPDTDRNSGHWAISSGKSNLHGGKRGLGESEKSNFALSYHRGGTEGYRRQGLGAKIRSIASMSSPLHKTSTKSVDSISGVAVDRRGVNSLAEEGPSGLALVTHTLSIHTYTYYNEHSQPKLIYPQTRDTPRLPIGCVCGIAPCFVDVAKVLPCPNTVLDQSVLFNPNQTPSQPHVALPAPRE